LVESTELGTTAIGEIATPAWVRKPFASHPIVSTVFLELLGMSEERIGQSLQLAHDHLNTGESRAGNWRAGLSPHAPYSAHPELIRRVCQLSAASQVPVAMHLAESHEELELLQSHSGPFLNLLIDLDAWNPSAIPRGIRPLDYLRLLADAHRALVIHGNFLTGEEVQFVAGRSERMSVVYCPRTHAYFQHAAYPLASMLDCGVNVALGTDSRASNPDLSMLAEMRHVAHQHTAVAPEVVLRLGTLSAAKALGLEHDMGSLAAGKLANLAIVPLGDDDTGDPYDLLFDSPHGVTATMYRGQFTVGPS
jgi:cytosine/adenosine deaminase-related metal-dependent hydrolase